MATISKSLEPGGAISLSKAINKYIEDVAVGVCRESCNCATVACIWCKSGCAAERPPSLFANVSALAVGDSAETWEKSFRPT